MIRCIDLSFRPYPAPVGHGDALVRPTYRTQPDAPVLFEPITESRDLSKILSYYEVNHIMSGVQPGEIFSKGTLTTKPYTTYAVYSNPEAEYPGASYVAELSTDYFAGEYVLVDLSKAWSKASPIKADDLRGALGALEKRESDPARPRIVVLRTGYSANRPDWPDRAYYDDSPYLSQEAAEYLASLGINTLVTDMRSSDPRFGSGKEEIPVYRILNHAGVLVVDDAAELDSITAKQTILTVGVPLQIRGATGGAARVFAINMREPTDFSDCSHVLDTYPHRRDETLPFVPPKTERRLDEFADYPNPIPGRIEPRETQGITQRTARLTPFLLRREDGSIVDEEMYIEYGHGTGTHIEAAFFDPWGRHGVPEEVLKRFIRMPKDRLVSRARFLDLSAVVGPLQQIDSTHLRDADPGLQKGDIAVIRADITDWLFYGSSPGNTPGLSPDAAMYLVEKGIRALVLDFAVEKSDPQSGNIHVKYTPNKVHYFLHKNNIPIVEWTCNQKLLRKDEFVIAIMSMPASHQGGFPAHVLALEEW